MYEPKINTEKLFTCIKDANYTWTEDPFEPEYVIESYIYEAKLVLESENLKHQLVVDNTWYYVF